MPANRPVLKGLPVLWLGCILVALGGCSDTAPESYDSGPPEANRFTKKVLVEGLDEPMQLEFDSQGRVYWIERKGGVKRLDETTGQVTTLGSIPLAVVGEGGLVGLLLDKDFETTRHLFLCYSAGQPEHYEMRLSRFTLGQDDRIDLGSEIVMMRWPIDETSHMGGGMTWDAEGNLYLSTGDNSSATQYTPIHWTNEGGRAQDAQRTSANTNDLRGKILRIHPEPDGSYTIPEGNLFPSGTPDTRSEIYIMGNRNPWRLSIDSETGYLHWGEVGPDAGADSAGIGPMGYDEFNVARSAGNFGWPYFIGYNRAYNSYDYVTKTHGEPFDPEHPVNGSPNNTGLRELPPAQPAALAYPYGVSEEFPFMATGGRNAVGGPVFHAADFKADAKRVFPDYYEGKWFIVDFVRNWIMVATLNEERTDVVALERFLPDIPYNSPLDMDFGPEGDLYVLEYGTQWFQQNPDARISKIEYNAGNRAPVVVASVDKAAGATPLQVTLSSEGTIDYDGDDLRYEWVVMPEAGGEQQRFSEPHPAVTFEKPGTYRAVLTVTDPAGASNSDEVEIRAGNEPPEVTLEITSGNRSFFFPGESITYAVRVTDREDGSLENGGISAEKVQVTAEFIPSGFTPADVEVVDRFAPDASLRHVRALQIMAGSDCSVCHTVNSASAGPSFRAVAQRYEGQKGAVDYLSAKIIEGGSGTWGEVAMPAHPALTPAQARALAEYVLGLAEKDAAPQRLPVQGRFTAGAQKASEGAPPQQGAYVLRAAYTDEGAGGVASITSNDVVLLRYPLLAPETADVISEGITHIASRDPGFIIGRDGAHVGFKGIDLTGIAQVDVNVFTRFYTWSHFIGATVEVRLDSPTGPLVGAPVTKRPAIAPGTPGEGSGGDNAPGGPVFFSEAPASVDASGVSGVRDVYVVFRNDTARPDEPLLLLTGIAFRKSSATQAGL